MLKARRLCVGITLTFNDKKNDNVQTSILTISWQKSIINGKHKYPICLKME